MARHDEIDALEITPNPSYPSCLCRYYNPNKLGSSYETEPIVR